MFVAVTVVAIMDIVCGRHCRTPINWVGTRSEDEARYSDLDLKVKFFNDVAVNKNTVPIVADEAMSVDLDLTLFQQQLQFQVGEESMSL